MLRRYGPLCPEQTLRVRYAMFSYDGIAAILVSQIIEMGAITVSQANPLLLRAAPEKFENDVFTLKTNQLFSVHSAPDKLENATITSHFGFVFEENLFREVT